MPSPLPPLVLNGMHGLGDNLHERAIVRELMRQNEVWLKTSWPQIFWDMAKLHTLPLKSPIGWMAKNEIRTVALYGKTQPPPRARALTNGYLHRMPRGVITHGSVLGTMANVCGVPLGDFRMPIAPEWREKADALLARLNPSKPLMVYRPTVAIGEANRLSSLAKVARNPDLNAYHTLVSAIRDRFFVVSLADLNQGVEWLVGPQIRADAEFHAGELDFETMAALTERADLVFTSPCFMTVLAQAVSTPMICVFGGFEGKESFSAGARYSPWLPIEPVNPCICWQYTCTHDKTIDLPLAHERIEQFLTELHLGNPAHTEKTLDPARLG